MTPTTPALNGSLQAVDFQPDDRLAVPPPPITEFGVARTHREVVDCWRLVHECYTESGLINPNPFNLHTSLQAVSPDTVTIYGKTHSRIDATLTVISDGPQGLPLDKVYKATLDQLRNHGHKLVEVGLLADARVEISKSLDQSFGTMRYAVCAAVEAGADIVIGVHPRHAGFYTRMVGMDVIGQLSQHPTVNNRPVVLMKLDISRMRLEPLPRLLRYIKANPVDPAEFDERYRFGKASMTRSVIGRFLNHTDYLQKISRFQTHPRIMPMQQAVSR